MYNTCHTLSFIQFDWLRDQPSAQEFIIKQGVVRFNDVIMM